MVEDPSGTTEMSATEQRSAVRERYGDLAETEASCCGDGDAASQSERVGYDADDVAELSDADLGLGCGTPVDHADLEPGETALDLGSGAGFDCFLAAREVGPDGRVIGVDMTPEMVEKARANAADRGATPNAAEQRSSDADGDGDAAVEFRLGEIEHLPVADGTVDAVLSNCVVNLSPDKPRVFAEAYRALRPGGRLAISDVVRTADLPADVGGDIDALTGCLSGAEPVDRLEAMLDEAGFVDVAIEPKDEDSFMREWSADHDPSEFTASAVIRGRKPAA